MERGYVRVNERSRARKGKYGTLFSDFLGAGFRIASFSRDVSIVEVLLA